MYNQVLTEESTEIMKASQEALRKIEEGKAKKRNPLEVLSETYQKASMGADLFEPYDALTWEGKLKVDALYFDQLLQKLEENDQIYKALGEYFKNVRMIYEFVNIKPEIYGNGINFTILENSNEEKRKKLSSVIFEYFDRNFYSLSNDQRKNKYLESSRELAKTLISEGANPDEAISFATKVSIVETLLTKIAFPFSVESRINYLVESDDYRKVFDQEALVALYDSFKSKVHSLSKVVSAVI